MNSRSVNQKRISKGLFGIDLQPKEAWMAISGLILTIILFLIAAPRLLVLLFPFCSLLVALLLHSRYPLMYTGFTWWMWFVAPFVRRLIDYRCNAMTFSSYHLTSMLVTSVCGITLYKKLLNSHRTGGMPYILCFSSILYAFVVGLVRQNQQDFGQTITNTMGWLCPMMFSFYIYSQWREYPAFRDNLQKVFLWAVLIMGGYGIFQFVVAPGWDTFALFQEIKANGLTTSTWIGTPEPFGIRVWGTMSNPFTYSANLMPGLLLLFFSKSKFRYIAIGVGYLTFLLSKSRTAWYSYLIALFIFFFSLKSKFQIRLFITIFAIVLIVLPLATIEPFSEVISDRLETVTAIGQDTSYQVRMAQFNAGIEHAMKEYIGWGLMGIQGIPTGFSITGEVTGKTSGLDNGYLVVIVSLGWLGLIPYVSGLGMMLYRLFSAPSSQLDLVGVVARSTVLSSIVRMATNNITTGEFALPIWGFLGIAMAAQKYFSTQEKLAKMASYSSTS